MDPLDLLRVCVPVFDRLHIGYFVTGSVASATYGEFRNTNDIDIVVHVDVDDTDTICNCFPEPEFYVSREAVRDAIVRAGQFNVLHSTSGFKIDFMVSSFDEFDRSRFARAKLVPLAEGFVLKMASPEDVIIKKLEYFKLGGSDKHLRDIAGILRVTGDDVDRDYIGRWVARLDLETEWEATLARADD